MRIKIFIVRDKLKFLNSAIFGSNRSYCKWFSLRSHGPPMECTHCFNPAALLPPTFYLLPSTFELSAFSFRLLHFSFQLHRSFSLQPLEFSLFLSRSDRSSLTILPEKYKNICSCPSMHIQVSLQYYVQADYNSYPCVRYQIMNRCRRYKNIYTGVIKRKLLGFDS